MTCMLQTNLLKYFTSYVSTKIIQKDENIANYGFLPNKNSYFQPVMNHEKKPSNNFHLLLS